MPPPRRRWSTWTKRTWPQAEASEPQDDIGTVRIGVNVCHCGNNIAGTIDIKTVVEAARQMEGVVRRLSMFSCAGVTQAEIARRLRESRANRIVIAACSPKTHESTFRRVMLKAGLNPYLMEMANLRNQDSWVHKRTRDEATQKAIDMIRMAVEKARRLEPLAVSHQPVIQTGLVIGGGIAGMTAAANLAKQGYETHLVERSRRLGGALNDLHEIAPAGISARALLDEKIRETTEARVNVHLRTDIEVIGGHIGNFHARLSTGEDIAAGAVILAMGAKPYAPAEFDYGKRPNVMTNVELERGHPLQGEHVTFVGCVGSRQNGGGCSRYCCESMIGQAVRLREQGKHVRVLYRDIRTYSRNADELYQDAAARGVQFFRIDPEHAPRTRSRGTATPSSSTIISAAGRCAFRPTRWCSPLDSHRRTKRSPDSSRSPTARMASSSSATRSSARPRRARRASTWPAPRKRRRTCGRRSPRLLRPHRRPARSSPGTRSRRSRSPRGSSTTSASSAASASPPAPSARSS